MHTTCIDAGLTADRSAGGKGEKNEFMGAGVVVALHVYSHSNTERQKGYRAGFQRLSHAPAHQPARSRRQRSEHMLHKYEQSKLARTHDGPEIACKPLFPIFPRVQRHSRVRKVLWFGRALFLYCDRPEVSLLTPSQYIIPVRPPAVVLWSIRGQASLPGRLCMSTGVRLRGFTLSTFPS